MYFANLIEEGGEKESVAVKVEEHQFSTDPKSISLKQHGVKRCTHSPTVTLLLLLISRAPGAALRWVNTTRGCAGGQEGSQVTTEGLWSTGRKKPVSGGTWQCLLGTGAGSVHPTQGSSKPWAKPPGQ